MNSKKEVLYNFETNTINYHLKKLFADKEIDENSVPGMRGEFNRIMKKINLKKHEIAIIIIVGLLILNNFVVIGVSYYHKKQFVNNLQKETSVEFVKENVAS